MKILTLNHNQRGIGTYGRCFYFSRELARHGHDVTMITTSRSSRFRSRVYYKSNWIGEAERPTGSGPWFRMIEGPSIGYKWLPGYGSSFLDVALRTREIRLGHYDLVYGFEYHPNVSWPIYLTRTSTPYRFFSDWCDWHAGAGNVFRGVKLMHRIDGFFEERIRLVADHLTTNSSALRQRALRIGVRPERITFIAQGSDPVYIRPLDLWEVRDRLGLPTDAPIVGMAIDHCWAESLSVFAKIRGVIPTARLLVIGQKKFNLREQAGRMGLADAVIETGWVSDEDYAAFMASADLLFLVMANTLFDLGRWPGKINDYLAAGRPTLVTDVGDAAAFLRQHDAGLVATNLDDLAEKAIYLLRDKAARDYYGERARQAAVTHLSWCVIGERINEIVNK